jgi:hypothetical protein
MMSRSRHHERHWVLDAKRHQTVSRFVSQLIFSTILAYVTCSTLLHNWGFEKFVLAIAVTIACQIKLPHRKPTKIRFGKLTEPEKRKWANEVSQDMRERNQKKLKGYFDTIDKKKEKMRKQAALDQEFSL